MATKDDNSSQAKVIVNARVAPDLVEKLDRVAEQMRPRPSKSQLVELAIEEFVLSRTKKGK